jgi:hypothetical protein
MSGLSATPESAASRPGGAEAPGERPQVIYVMGAGRSGSTVLGITLGNCEGVFFAGELDNWLVRSGLPQVESPERLRFWSEVHDELEDADGAAELFGNDAQRAIERSLSLFRVNKWPARRRLRRRYRAVAEDLYRAVTRAAHVTHLTDTSHYPLRARELQRIGGIDLYLLFLVRDPQSVVASFNRHDVLQFTKSTFHTNVYLWVTHLLSLLVFLRHPRERRLLVRYEDFVEDPAGVVARILQCARCATAALPDFTALTVGLPLQGNRVTKSEVLSLKRKADPLPSSRATALLQAPMMAVLSRLRPRAAVTRPPA